MIEKLLFEWVQLTPLTRMLSVTTLKDKERCVMPALATHLIDTAIIQQWLDIAIAQNESSEMIDHLRTKISRSKEPIPLRSLTSAIEFTKLYISPYKLTLT